MPRGIYLPLQGLGAAEARRKSRIQILIFRQLKLVLFEKMLEGSVQRQVSRERRIGSVRRRRQQTKMSYLFSRIEGFYCILYNQIQAASRHPWNSRIHDVAPAGSYPRNFFWSLNGVSQKRWRSTLYRKTHFHHWCGCDKFAVVLRFKLQADDQIVRETQKRGNLLRNEGKQDRNCE